MWPHCWWYLWAWSGDRRKERQFWEPGNQESWQKLLLDRSLESTLLREQLVFSSVQSLSRVRLFATPWIAACQASLSITNSRSSLRLMSVESMMPSSHLILSRPLLLLPPIPPSIRVFSNESTLPMRWPKYWSFSFSITPSKEIPGLISFRMDWLDLLAVQGTLKSLQGPERRKQGDKSRWDTPPDSELLPMHPTQTILPNQKPRGQGDLVCSAQVGSLGYNA